METDDKVLCRCGMVSWSQWNECNDLAYLCPFDDRDNEEGDVF